MFQRLPRFRGQRLRHRQICRKNREAGSQSETVLQEYQLAPVTIWLRHELPSKRYAVAGDLSFIPQELCFQPWRELWTEYTKFAGAGTTERPLRRYRHKAENSNLSQGLIADRFCAYAKVWNRIGIAAVGSQSGKEAGRVLI